MSKNSHGIPIGQLLGVTENCNKDNGTLIKIPIKNDDVFNFTSEIKKQLAYMNNIFYKNINLNSYTYDETSFNDSKIISGNGWKHKVKNSPLNELHLSLENITYSIDWSELGMLSINVPFALTFKTGELQPTPSRESIVYSRESIKLIKDRVNSFVMSFVDKFNSKNELTIDFEYWRKERYNNNKKLAIATVNGSDVHIDMSTLLENFDKYDEENLKRVTYKPFADLGLKNTYIPRNLFFDYKITRKADWSNGKSNEVSYDNFENRLTYNKVCMIDSGEKSNYIKNYYILECLLSKENLYFARKLKTSLKEYISILRLRQFDKSKWRKIIAGYQNIIEAVVNSKIIGEYKSIHVNPNWELDYKSGNSKYSPNAKKRDINKEISTLQLNDYGWRRKDVKLKDIENFKGILIYGQSNDKSRMNDVYNMFTSVRSFLSDRDYVKDEALQVLCVSIKNYKTLGKMDNTFTVEELLSSKLKTFTRVATSYKIKKEVEELWFFNNFEHINSNISNDYKDIYHYARNNSNIFNSSYSVELNKEFIEGLLKVADKNNLYDKHIIKKLNNLRKYLEGVEIIRNLDYKSKNINENVIKFLKTNKKKVNNEHYLKTPSQLLEDLITK